MFYGVILIKRDQMSTMDESLDMEKSDQGHGKVDNAGEEGVYVDDGCENRKSTECDNGGERRDEGKGGDDEVDKGGGGSDDEKKDGSDQEKNDVDDEEPPSEIVHSSLSSLAGEIDDFVMKMMDLRIEMQKKEEDEREEQRKKDDDVNAGIRHDNDDDKPVEGDVSAAKDDEKHHADANEETTEEGEVVEPAKPAMEVPDFVDNFVSLVEAKIVNYEFSEGTTKWRQMEGNEPPFFDNVGRLYNLANALSHLSKSEPDYAASFNRVSNVLHKAVLFIEEEFKSVLEDINTPESKQDSADGSVNEGESVVNDEVDFAEYSTEQISDLNQLAKAMISAGYDTECCQVYFMMRRNVFEGGLIKKLGFEKSSIDEVLKMNWETLGREIGTWVATFKQCSNVNFRGERRLAASVFTDQPLFSDSLSANLIKPVVMQLLNFAEAVAMTKRSAEKLFKVLDMYETIRDVIPTLNEAFPEQYVYEMKTEALSAKSRLGEAAVSIFCDLENSIKSDTNRTPVPGGAVHPLTRYTINYLKYACEYKNTLEQVFRDHLKVERADSTSAPDYEIPNHIDAAKAQESPFVVQLVKVMDLLDSYIESKSKLYKDISLSYIFLMNNGRYILQRIRSDVNELMGDSWCRKRSSDLRSYHKNYQRETWGKLLQCLTQEGLNVKGKVSKPVLKERFKNFNTLFDEIHRTQSTWIVSDEQLQSELRVSISAVVIPAYRAFLGRFNQHFTPGRQTEKYVKYQPEDIETCVEELFDGKKKP